MGKTFQQQLKDVQDGHPANLTIDWEIFPRQKLFIECECNEVLYGGARGGGKSHAQVVDAFVYAWKYNGSKQLILRRTFQELEMSIIRLSLELYPSNLGTYNYTNRIWKFPNGSTIQFGYCDNEGDVRRYRSAEFDVIRIDEATDFSEEMYIILLGSIRGTNSFPKQMKCTSNPGGVGHAFFKQRFIDMHEPNIIWHDAERRSYEFIPATVYDNLALMEKDPQYIGNLEQLPPDERKMYLMGDWNVFKGQFFPEYNENIHVIEPFVIPKSWRKFISMDYGFDTTCALWWAVDNTGAREYVYRELHQPNMTLSEAANKILEYTSKDEEISYISASPDLINRSHDTGMSGFEIMRNCGLKGIRAADDRRIAGWIECREHMKSFPNLMGDKLTSRLQIFKTCEHLRHSLKNLIFDDKTPNDANDKPHEITHAADAFRYGCMSRPSAAPEQEVKELTEWERFYERENEHERINGYSNW